MGDVITIGKSTRKNRLRERNRGKTLCGRGFHRWRVDSAHKFDVKQGRLATVSRCERCGETKTEYR